jgi:DNA-directed RNA polymerase I subunit RPA2
MLDGRLMGYIDPTQAERLVHSLRVLKIKQLSNEFDCVPSRLEIAYMAPKPASEAQVKSGETRKQKFFPGIFLASTPARFVRPVKNVELDAVEFIGPLEQVNLSIACLDEDVRSDTTH